MSTEDRQLCFILQYSTCMPDEVPGDYDLCLWPCKSTFLVFWRVSTVIKRFIQFP